MVGYAQGQDDYDIDSDGEEFNEDKLDDDEYEQLYAQLPLLKKELESYNDDILEIDMKEALYFNYFKLNESVEELKEKYPKKKKIIIPPPSPTLGNSSPGPEIKKPMSKLAQLAQIRKQQQQLTQEQKQKEVPVVQEGGEKKPPSKLALLAKSRAASANRSALSLDNLKRVPKETTETKKTLSLGGNSINSSIKMLRKRTKEEAEAPPIAMHSTTAPDVLIDRSSSTTNVPKKLSADIPPYNVVFDDSNLLKLAKSPLSCFLFNENDVDEVTKKKRKLNQYKDIFEPITNHEVNSKTAKKIQASFDEPSPDQKVLDAQSAAFEANLSGLSIEEAKSQQEKKVQDVKKDVVVKQTKPFKKIDLDSRIKSSDKYLKPSKSFVVIGHVDAGKSTLLGRILYDVGVVDAKQLNKLTREADKAGKGSFALAWIMDQTTEERSRGVTVDICATNFETAKSKYTAIDAPGHKDFVPQMISGVTQANYAVVVIDSINGEFESGFNMDGQTKEHTLLARYLGVERIIIAVNKMDKENWSQDRFKEIQLQMLEFLTNPEDDVAFKPDQIEFIPLSGLTGNNLVKRDQSIKEFSWYTGPTLIEYLDLLDIPKGQQIKSGEELSKEEFKLTINDVFESSNSDFIVTGKIISGVVQPGETVNIVPSNEFVQVQSITTSVSDQQNVDFAIQGEIALLKFKSNQLKNSIASIATGDIISGLNSPLISTDTLTCEVKLFQMSKPLLVGTPFVLFRNTFQSLARITKIIDIVLEGKKKKKMHLVSRQVAIIEIQCERPLPVVTYEQNEVLGRVVLRREGLTVGAGKIVEAEKILK